MIGGGESASDVALEAAKVAKQCWVSLRDSTGWVVPRKRGAHASDNATHRGLWALPREYGGTLSEEIIAIEREQQDPISDAVAKLNDLVQAENGIWGTYGTKTLALPQAMAHHGCQIVKEITTVTDGGRTLETADQQTLEEVDIVIFCTGYHSKTYFLPNDLIDYDPRELYKQMFHPKYGDRVAFVGRARPAFGSQFGIVEMQARLCGLIFSNKHHLPSPEEMSRVAKKDFEELVNQFEENAVRIRSLVDYHRFMDDLAELIGCTPPFWKYFFLYL